MKSILLFSLICMGLPLIAEEINLVLNGDFSEHHTHNKAHSMKWMAIGFSGEAANKTERVTEGEVTYQSIVSAAYEKNHFGIAPREFIQLSPEWKTLDLSMTFRVLEQTPGKDSWNRFLVAAIYFNDFDKKISYEIKLKQNELSKDWVTQTATLTVPQNATQLKLEIKFLGADGVAHVRNVKVSPK